MLTSYTINIKSPFKQKQGLHQGNPSDPLRIYDDTEKHIDIQINIALHPSFSLGFDKWNRNLTKF